MSERDCDECDLIAHLYDGAVTESEFARRMTHDFDKDWLEIVAIIVEARARSCGNG